MIRVSVRVRSSMQLPCKIAACVCSCCHALRLVWTAFTVLRAGAHTPGQAAVVVVGHVLLFCAGDGVVVLQQRDRRLQRISIRPARVIDLARRNLTHTSGLACVGRVPSLNLRVRVWRWREQLQLPRGLQERGALADEALGRRAAREVACRGWTRLSCWHALAKVGMSMRVV